MVLFSFLEESLVAEISNADVFDPGGEANCPILGLEGLMVSP